MIQHNMGVLNASIVLKDNRKKLEKSTEKLSSGYRINRSADDAAGLAISEKMRKKIKGLERGMENVQEGISLCQVADGALNEVSDIIQRVRELSIQAYNGTNSKSDRKVIQDEVDQCLKEMDRVFETTKFNEVYIFRNGNKVEGDTFHPETYIETVWVETVKDIPDWLKINDNSVPLNPDMNDRPKIEEHSGYLNGQTQELNGIMRREFAYVDSAGEEQYIHLYYGNDQGTTADGYRWAGDFLKNDVGTDAYNALMDPNHEFFKYIDQHRDTNGDYTGWTPGFDDNVSAKLDFSELAGVRDAKELYNKLADLVGAEICFPCGTCSNMEAIRFGGEFISVGGVKFSDTVKYYLDPTEINLSGQAFSWEGNDYNGYFNAILDVMAMDDTDPDKAARTEDLAKAIAKDLAQSTYHALDGMMTRHFDRTFMDPGTEPYTVYVYDYRDTDATATGTETKIWTSSQIGFYYDREVEGGYYTHYEGWNSKQIWIQASDEVGDGIPIHSRYLSLERLELLDYRIDSYACEETWEDEEAYQKRLQEWKDRVPPPKVEVHRENVPVTRMKDPAQFRSYFDGNGELRTEMVKPATYETTMEERDVIHYIYDEPRPTRKCDVREVYKPSELSLLDDALTAVVDLRSYYGAIQNRLEHTYNNNSNADENITAAESRIRDTDMAKEVVRNSMLNILQQAGMSMLTQANQTSQNVNVLLGS